MSSSATGDQHGTLIQIQRAQARPPAERCDLCGVAVPTAHQHLVRSGTRSVLCACDACAILFDARPGRQYRRVPRDVFLLTEFDLAETDWTSLGVPVQLAFFSKRADGATATYPSPAGPLESPIDRDVWLAMERRNPRLALMETEVQALLVNRMNWLNARRPEYYLAPIDQCYALVGLIREGWRGFSGGTELWQQVEQFFVALRRGALTK